MRGSRWVAPGLAAVAAVLAIVTHALLFAHGSLNNDEVVYLTQAQLISHGHLLLHAGVDARPWFFALGPHGLVPKYLPTVGSWLGASEALTGSVVPALAVTAGGLGALVARLCRQVLGERRGAWAAALVVLSPLTVIESALALSYVPFLLVVTAAWSLLLDLRTAAGAPRLRAAAIGVLSVVAAATRPYDAVLLLVPAFAVVLLELRRPGLRLVLPAVLGAVPPTVAVLAYNAYATGSALTLPFGMLDAADTVGYGHRQLFPEDPIHYFGPLQGVQGTVAHFLRAPLTWYALGAVVLPLALVRLAAWRRLTPGVRMLAAPAVALFAGYLVFWGPWNASVLWGGTRVIGPFYALSLLLPAAVLAVDLVTARGWALPSRPTARRVLAGLGAVAAVLSILQLTLAAREARHQAVATRQVLADAAVDPAPAGGTLLNVDPPYLGHPVGGLVNASGSTDLRLAADVPAASLAGRADATMPDLLQVPFDVYAKGAPLVDALTRERLVAGSALRLTVTATGMTDGAVVVSLGGVAPVQCPTPGTAGAVVTITAGHTVSCAGGAVPDADVLRRIGPPRLCAADRDCLDLNGVATVAGELRNQAFRPVPLTVAAGGMQLLADDRVLTAHGTGWIGVAASPA